MKLFISGSLAYDRIMDFPGRFSEHLLPDKLHILNVCFLVDGLKEKFGGTAGNIAYSLALLGEKPIILAAAGSDFGRYREWLEKHQLSLEGIFQVDDLPTAGAYITTDKADNQITAFNPGAMTRQAPYRFDGLDPAQSLAVVSPGNLDDMREFPRRYRELKIDYILDPGQNIPAFDGPEMTEMITGAKILVANDYEMEMIRQNTRMSNDDILDRCQAIITTLGEKGCAVITGEGTVEISAVPVKHVLDPTGAGDAFRSGLVKGLVMGKPLAEAAKVGSTAASFAVERLGTQEHRYTEAEFWARHDAHFA
jgi:adenosine kinase